MTEKECTGCKIANEESNFIIYETENFVLLQDPEVQLKGFLIVQAKKHVNSLINFNEEEQIELLQNIACIMQELISLNLVDQNYGQRQYVKK